MKENDNKQQTINNWLTHNDAVRTASVWLAQLRAMASWARKCGKYRLHCHLRPREEYAINSELYRRQLSRKISRCVLTSPLPMTTVSLPTDCHHHCTIHTLWQTTIDTHSNFIVRTLDGKPTSETLGYGTRCQRTSQLCTPTNWMNHTFALPAEAGPHFPTQTQTDYWWWSGEKDRTLTQLL